MIRAASMLVPRLALALCSAGVVAGCAAGSSVGPVAAELGTGEWEFTPLVDGEEVHLAAGSQGGFHIWTSVYASGLEASRGRLAVTTSIADRPDIMPEHTDVQVTLTAAPDGGIEFLGWPARLLHPGCARDHLVHLAVAVTDARHRSAQDERDVMVRWDPPTSVDASCDIASP